MSKSASEWTYGVAACAVGIALLQFYPVPEAALADNPIPAAQYAAADSVLEGHNAVAETSGSTGINDALNADKPAKRRFDMSHVQSVRMRVWGNAELNGEYSIEADQTLSLPGIGRIEIGNMTPGELEKVISEKLSAFSRRDLTVSLEVTRYRSYYIVGQIAEPGAIEWRPGLKVIQAISLAGGVTRPSSAAVGSDVVQRDQAQMQLKYAMAQLARLKAEKDGRSSVEASQEFASLMLGMPAQQQSIAGFMAQQNTALNEQKAIIQTQLVGLERDKEGAQREMETAIAQEEAIGKQVEIAKAQLESRESLKETNLVAKPRLLSQRSDLITAQVRFAEARALVERARGRVDTVSRQIISLQQERRAALNERIETLERDVAQLETSLGTTPRTALNLRYHITREGKDEMSTVSAAVDTEVMPGDVVIVSSGAQEFTTTSDAGQAIERRVDTQAVLEASAALSASRGVPGRLQGALRTMADRLER